MGWTFLWLMVGLKLPIAALLYIVWWAIHQTPEPATGQGEGGARRPRHPRPPFPRRPRSRGPHGAAVAASPPRVRTSTAPLVARAKHRV
jgi:hypothetical protein